MTSNDIEKVQILATTKDGKHILAISDNKLLIRLIVGECQFMMLKDDIFEECSLKEILE